MTPKSKARAQCGNSARWDLCGGQPEPAKTKGCPYRNCDPTKANESKPQVSCRKALDDIKTESYPWTRDKPGRCLFMGQAVSGMYAARAWVRLLHGTWEPALRYWDQRSGCGAHWSRERDVQVAGSTRAGVALRSVRGGPSGSSAEGSVMGLERSGRAVQVRLSVNREVGGMS
jgi:hypothetical protein